MEFALPAVSPKAASLRFWYGASIAEFVSTSAEKIIGQLTLNSSFDVDRSQAAAWLTEIEFLQSTLSDLAGSIFFEFNIPRMGRRIDVVLVIGPVIFAVDRFSSRQRQQNVRQSSSIQTPTSFIGQLLSIKFRYDPAGSISGNATTSTGLMRQSQISWICARGISTSR